MNKMPESNPLFSSIFPDRLSKGDRKKLEIVEIAVRLYGERGVDRITFDDIAKALNTTRSHVNYHFKNQDELNIAVVRHMMTLGHEFTFEAMRSALSAKEQLIRYVDGYVDFFLKNTSFIPVILYFYYSAALPGPLRDLQTQIRALAHERIAELIKQIYFQARKKPPKDLMEIAEQAQILLLGGMILNVSTGKPIEVRRTQEMKEKIVSGMELLAKIRIRS